MITKITIQNFKKFEDVTIDLSQPVVFIGPNNSGKTTALQALALWNVGVKKWIEKHGKHHMFGLPKKRTGTTINRKDLTEISLPETKLLWKDKRTHHRDNKSNSTSQIYIVVNLEGVDNQKTWKCGFEFYYANEESFYCRPIIDKDKAKPSIPDEALDINIAFLPPMSGLSDKEFLKQQGEIDFLIGQGQTAQVLRNLCYHIYTNDNGDKHFKWNEIVGHIDRLFGIELLEPEYSDRSEIVIKYKEQNGVILDLPASGRGVQQILLLLVYLYSNPKTILMMDEPDAHLEILRQRETFNLLIELAEEMGSQIIAASHSEVVLNEAASKGNVVAFVGKPHLMNKKSEVIKSLSRIGFDDYYQAETKGWVLYLEGPSDLHILKGLSKILGHSAIELFERPFVYYVEGNVPKKAREHFHGLKEAKNDLTGIALYDRIDKEISNTKPLHEFMWKKREIENYFCTRSVIERFIIADIPEGELFSEKEKKDRLNMLKESFDEIESALKSLDKGDPWTDDFKVSDEFLEPLFRKYSSKKGIPMILPKREFYQLVKYIKPEEINEEVKEKLDAFVEIVKTIEY